MTVPSPAEKRLQARSAAHWSWAATPDRAARLAPMWQGREDRFERLVDPDGVMSPQERAKAAASARKAFYLDLSRKGLAARRAKRAAADP